MMRQLLSKTLLTLALLQSTTTAEPLRTFFGTNKGEGIYTATFETTTGSLSPITLAATTHTPGFLAIHPNQQFLYSTNAEFDTPNSGGVSAFRIHEDGSLTLLNKQPTLGRNACHLSIDTAGKSVVATNYSSGSVTAFQVLKDGSLSPADSTHPHAGSGEHANRQKAPHPHSAYVHPNNQYVYVPDLGIDKVMIYSLNSAKGTLSPAGHADVLGGSQGPRHMKFSNDGKQAYVLNELSLTLATYSVNTDTGQLDHIETISVFTDDNQQAVDTMSGAEIRIHPNGNLVYTSTRDLKGQGRDSISTFRRAQDGTLQLIANTPASVHFPRNFNIDPTGQWLIIAGQKSSTLAIFSIDKKTGALALKHTDIPFEEQPSCVEFLKSPDA